MKVANEEVLTATAVMDALEACDTNRILFAEDISQLLIDLKIDLPLPGMSRIMKYE